MPAFIHSMDMVDTSSSGIDALKAAGNNAANKVRKGSLSAVIDKLKTRYVSDDSPPNTPTQPTPPHAHSFDLNVAPVQLVHNATVKEKSMSGSSGGGSTSSTSSKAGTSSGSSSSSNNSEYMVKHSSDVMKITINKTRTKDSHSPSSKQAYPSASGSHSPKMHTGLKPGVNSGPASKKPHSSQLDVPKETSSFQKRSLNIDSIGSNSMSHLNNQSHR